MNITNQDLLKMYFRDKEIVEMHSVADFYLKDFATWLDRAAQLPHADGKSVESTSVDNKDENDRPKAACPKDRHQYYVLFLNYEFCPYCGVRLSSL